ncbi:MAG: DUF3987 domain-containing protein [Deltaproteobacteria bacterium]|nr:DUF3987 domain-containing protein [Deltaproteobacteria bacterium]
MAQRKLKNWLNAYLEYTRYSEALEIFHFWSGVGTLSGALRRKVYFDQGYFKWTPNFYIIFVADPGIATKSTTVNIGASLLREIPNIHFGPNAITTAALIPYLAKAVELVQMPDQTFVPMSCLTFVSSELGTLLDPSDRRMLDILCDLWDGWEGSWSKVTKTQGSDEILNPWLNIMACTTPSWLADNLPRQVVGGGFTSRCVFVYGDAKRQLVPYPKEVIPEEHEEIRKLLLADLELISTLKGEFSLTPEARELGISWYEEHWKNPPAELAADEAFKGYLTRKQGHVHKLAMVLSTAERDDLVITKDLLEKAIRIISAVEQDMPRVFRSIYTTSGQEDTLHLISLVKAHPGISNDTLYRLLLHRMKLDDFKSALSAAAEAGLLRIENQAGVVRLYPVTPKDKGQ